jgi:hypothetical protein
MDPVPTRPSMLEQLQQVAVTRLSGDPLFSGASSNNGKGIPIIQEYKKEIIQEIDLALGSVGICILILTPAFEFIDNMIFSLSGWALISITVFENVVVNQSLQGTGIRSIMAAQRVLALLHRFPHGLTVVDVVGDMSTPGFIGIKRPIELTNEGPPLQYTVNFQSYVSLP